MRQWSKTIDNQANLIYNGISEGNNKGVATMSTIEEKITNLIADPAGLRAWLEAQPEAESFRVASSDYCPLACYLTARLNLGPALLSVGFTLITVSNVAHAWPLPHWAQVFVGAVDSYGPDGPEVSRDQALGCLDGSDV